MSDDTKAKQDEETNFIGKTRFYDEDGNIVESLNQEGKVLVINFPGSGMIFNGKDEDEVKESAVETCEETQKLLPQDALSQAFVCTAVYENKADKAIKEYNEENNNTHSNEIFEQILKPMIIEGDYDKTLDNLSRVIFRGHCFGCMVIAELENLLEAKLKEQFNDAECKELLSAPQALISSPALQLDKYPKYFETTAIVNNSDRTITNEEYCGDRLKQDLRELAGFDKKDLIFFDKEDLILFDNIADRTIMFAKKLYDRLFKKDTKEDLISLNARDIMNVLTSQNAGEIKDKSVIPDGHDIKVSKKQQNNVHFIISNRAALPSTYGEMKTRIEKRIGTKENDDISYDEKYLKQVKKNIGGHEYFFLPDDLKSEFETSFSNAFERCQTHIKIRDIRKRLHNSNIDVLLQENMETQENKLQIGKTGNSSTGKISKQTAKTQIEYAKQAMLQRRSPDRR